MKDITLFHKILYPIDILSDNSQNIDYAVKLATKCKAELVFLYSYRLKTQSSGESDVISAKKRTEEESEKHFQQIKSQLLENAGIQYSFLCEVGFIIDRILYNIKTENVDLIVLSKGMKEKINNETKSFESHSIEQVSCPIMLMPDLQKS